MEKIVTDANFAETLATDKLVVVDFWATWCGPCRALAPVIESIAQKYEGKAVIGKCNIDENEEAPMQFRIRSIPTLLFFKGGQVVDKIVGLSSETEISAKIDSLL